MTQDMKPVLFRQSVSADREAYSNLKASANPRASLIVFKDPWRLMENRYGLSFPVLLGSGAKADVLEKLEAVSTFDWGEVEIATDL